MKAIDDYINGNLTDAKRRAKQRGRGRVRTAMLEEYGFSHAKAAIIEAYLFDNAGWQQTCDRLAALQHEDQEEGFEQEKVGKPFRQNTALVEAARHGQALSGEPDTWRTADYEGEKDRLVVSTTGELIADCYPPCHEDYALPENYKANARLIAAAPELLAALEVARQILDIAYNPTRDGDGETITLTRTTMRHAANAARAAIAKAKGTK